MWLFAFSFRPLLSTFIDDYKAKHVRVRSSLPRVPVMQVDCEPNGRRCTPSCHLAHFLYGSSKEFLKSALFRHQACRCSRIVRAVRSSYCKSNSLIPRLLSKSLISDRSRMLGAQSASMCILYLRLSTCRSFLVVGGLADYGSLWLQCDDGNERDMAQLCTGR